MTLLKIVVTLEACGDKLGVVNQAVLVGVDNVHGVEDFYVSQGDLIDLLETILKLFVGKRTISVLVHLGEGET